MAVIVNDLLEAAILSSAAVIVTGIWLTPAGTMTVAGFREISGEEDTSVTTVGVSTMPLMPTIKGIPCWPSIIPAGPLNTGASEFPSTKTTFSETVSMPVDAVMVTC